MTLAELRDVIASHAPGSFIPRDWLLSQLEGVEAEGPSTTLADMSSEEAGELLHRSPSTVRDYCRRRLLPGAYRQRGREWRVPRSAVLAFQRAEAEPKRPARVSARRAEEPDLGSWRAALGKGR